MLSLFNRFLSRIRKEHPIFANKHIFIYILQFLEGKDLFQVYQVSFLCKTTIESFPTLNICLLRFRMKKSNECVAEIKQSTTLPQKNSAVIPKFVQRAFIPAFPYTQIKRQVKSVDPKKKVLESVDLNSEKWTAFVENFKEYARIKGFKISKKNEFDNKSEWKKYKTELEKFYKNYADFIIRERNRARMIEDQTKFGFSKKIADQYRNLIQSINYKFHTFTNYRYFPNKKERSEKSKDSLDYI